MQVSLQPHNSALWLGLTQQFELETDVKIQALCWSARPLSAGKMPSV